MKPEIRRLLRKSTLAFRILRFLSDEQEYYTSEIARKLHTDVSNITYCITGHNKRYRLSLLDLRLIQTRELHNYKYYSITPYGKEVIKEYIEILKNMQHNVLMTSIFSSKEVK